MSVPSWSSAAAPPAAVTSNYVVVLFTDLSDSTALSGSMEAETYATMIDEVRSAFRDAVEARGGVVNQYQGDGLQALFGHPTPSEDDGRNTLEAALDVHARVRALRTTYGKDGARHLNVHSGIHAGLALVRPGDDLSGKIELFGPVPGLAKHLSDTAGTDEIVFSEESMGPPGRRLGGAGPEQMSLKGLKLPLPVRRVLAEAVVPPTRTAAPAAHGIAPLAGRGAELRRLHVAQRSTRGGHLRVMQLCAEAGFGKTRLAEEYLAIAAADGIRVFRGHCDPELRAAPLQPFTMILRGHLGIDPDTPADVVASAVERHGAGRRTAGTKGRQMLLQVLNVQTEVTPEVAPAGQVLDTMCEALASAVRQGPTVFFADDWHWADGASRELLRSLRAHHSDLPLLVLLATREPVHDSDSPQDDAVDTLRLGPLDPTAALATVRALLPTADPFTARQIVQQAGGYPLCLEELCRFVRLADTRRLADTPPDGPAWLKSMIAARTSRLPPAQRVVLEAAAVIGHIVPAAHLEQLSGMPQRHPDVQALAIQGLLLPTESPGALRFNNGITRDVVYEKTSLQDRRDLHRRMAGLLAPVGSGSAAEFQVCEGLAYHVAGWGDAAQAARYSTMAGDRAAAASSIDRAKAHYGAALRHLDRLPPSEANYRAWRSVVRRLGWVSVFDPGRDELGVFEQARARARDHGDASGEAFAGYWLAYVRYALGDARASLRHVAEALDATDEAAQPELVAELQLLQAQALAAAGDVDDAMGAFDAALSKAPAASADPRTQPGRVFAMACRASLDADQGRLQAALAGFDNALAELPGPGHEVEASVLCLRANALLWHHRWPEAARDAAAALTVAERVHSLYLLAMARALGAWAAWQMTGDHTAWRSLADATAWLATRDKRLFISLNHGRLAEAAVALGLETEARIHGAAALRRWREGDALGAAQALRALARQASAAGDRPRALRRLAWADRVAVQRGAPHEQLANRACRAETGG